MITTLDISPSGRSLGPIHEPLAPRSGRLIPIDDRTLVAYEPSKLINETNVFCSPPQETDSSVTRMSPLSRGGPIYETLPSYGISPFNDMTELDWEQDLGFHSPYLAFADYPVPQGIANLF